MKKEISLMLLILIVPLALAVDCPRGIENDPYPGICNLYTDSNNNQICDLSEEDSVLSEAEIENVQTANKREYYFLQIAIVMIIVYAVSFILSRKGVISPVRHKKFWNLLLLVSFLGVGISGILLVLRISFGLNGNLGINMLFWHVETGIAMTLIAIFHILWHFSYFKSYVR